MAGSEHARTVMAFSAEEAKHLIERLTSETQRMNRSQTQEEFSVNAKKYKEVASTVYRAMIDPARAWAAHGRALAPPFNPDTVHSAALVLPSRSSPQHHRKKTQSRGPRQKHSGTDLFWWDKFPDDPALQAVVKTYRQKGLQLDNVRAMGELLLARHGAAPLAGRSAKNIEEYMVSRGEEFLCMMLAYMQEACTLNDDLSGARGPVGEAFDVSDEVRILCNIASPMTLEVIHKYALASRGADGADHFEHGAKGLLGLRKRMKRKREVWLKRPSRDSP